MLQLEERIITSSYLEKIIILIYKWCLHFYILHLYFTNQVVGPIFQVAAPIPQVEEEEAVI